MLGTFRPRWLASPMQLGFLSIDPQERIGPFALGSRPVESRFPKVLPFSASPVTSMMRARQVRDDPGKRDARN